MFLSAVTIKMKGARSRVHTNNAKSDNDKSFADRLSGMQADSPGSQTKRERFIYEKYFKRPLDLLLSLIAIIILSPLLVCIALLVKVRLGSPVLFKQERPGLNEKPFILYKFRTMTDTRDINGELLDDSERLTRFGEFLRSTSLDELPELLNILRGDMSLIGPRPLLTQYLSLYNAHQRRRHEVRPGLSGLAQVSGRNQISWDEKFNLDIKYIDTISFLGDCKIVFLTFVKIFTREGINQEGEATMEDFKGTLL